MITDKKYKNGFSLSENITVLGVLGIIIVLTVPKLIASKNDGNNRLLVRKAVVTYQEILDKEFTKSTGIRTTTVLNNKISNANCGLVRNQLDLVSETNSCIFTTKDGVRWNISSPSDAVISISSKEEPTYDNASNANSKVYYIPFAVRNRSVNVLEFDSGINNGLQNRTSTLDKTRNFIMSE